eukprot:TRINITY_DN25254_c0_g1_i1.p1 TRINITY_DN25254_c0_g1~~TRINITY_DN25254_c0_g1_i1.p1  ORF type:complete len:100 (+),score=18.52 TRINITY_DN25254_c0_g1_i1:24-302(+)
MASCVESQPPGSLLDEGLQDLFRDIERLSVRAARLTTMLETQRAHPASTGSGGCSSVPDNGDSVQTMEEASHDSSHAKASGCFSRSTDQGAR